MERKKLSELVAKLNNLGGLNTRQDMDECGYLQFLDNQGILLFSVSVDDVFDQDGNFFENDLP